MHFRHSFIALVFLFFLCGTLYASPTFPPLTGRVVDDAHILSAATIQQLSQTLEDYEKNTTNQIVVYTAPNLQGYPIEEYGYELGRYWKIGQKDKNNGVILLVAPKEHKARIEVGYGLEPILTDAVSSMIIQDVVLPDFRQGHFEQGIVRGTQTIIEVLGGKKATTPHNKEDALPGWLMGVLLLLFLWFAIKHPFLAAMILSNSGSGSNSGGSNSGFGGGGGSFGGGGSSGSW